MSAGWAAGLERICLLAAAARGGEGALPGSPTQPLTVAVLPVLPREGGGTATLRRELQSAALRLAALLSSPQAERALSELLVGGGAPAPAPVALLLEPDAKLSRLLSAAAAGGADVALIVAEDELRAGTVAIKNLRAGTQRAVTLPRAARATAGGNGGDDDAPFWRALGEADAGRWVESASEA